MKIIHKSIYFILAIFTTFYFTNNANAKDKIKATQIDKFQLDLRLGVSNQEIGFDTPNAHSILSWDPENIEGGVDLRFMTIDKVFVNAEYTYSNVKGGKSADDDQQNGSGEYSKHGVFGHTNDYKLSLDYRLLDDGIFSVSPSIGAFYKDIKVTSSNGFGFGGSYGNFRSFEDLGASNQTNSKYMGATVGVRIEAKANNVKSTLVADLLIPTRYEGDQIWHGRNPTLYWKLRGGSGTGARIKADFGYNLDSFLLKYVKFYTFYETITVNHLHEEQASVALASNHEGKATYEGYGAGLALEF